VASVRVPGEFLVTWTFEEIERDWLAGAVIAVLPPDIVSAFDRVEGVLGRDRIFSSRERNGMIMRGSSPTLTVVSVGKRLAALSAIVEGREAFITQLRARDAGTFAELTAISLLFSQEPTVVVELYPAIASGRVPDFRVRRTTEEPWTYVEVTAADTSEAQQRATQVLERLAIIVRDMEGQFGLEVFLRREPTDSELTIIERATADFAMTEADAQRELPDGLGVLTIDHSQGGVVGGPSRRTDSTQAPCCERSGRGAGWRSSSSPTRCSENAVRGQSG
jgi:hypothetical protein